MTFDPFVQAVQKKLIKRGYNVGAGGADGLNGNDTVAAITAFQKAHGITPTGTVTETTWTALDSNAVGLRVDRDKDPERAEPLHVKPTWPRQAEVEKFYGPVGKNQVMVTLPYPFRLAWDTGKLVKKVSLHEKVADSAARVLERVADAYPHEKRQALGLDLFGGSLNVRKMRGGSKWSMHSWGIAIDFDPIRNQLKWNHYKANLAKPECNRFWLLWEQEGWVSLGRTRDFDWMHVQAARL